MNFVSELFPNLQLKFTCFAHLAWPMSQRVVLEMWKVPSFETQWRPKKITHEKKLHVFKNINTILCDQENLCEPLN